MDYASMTNPALATLCTERGLKTYGSKQQLIDRLTKHDTQLTASQETATMSDDFPDLAGLGEDTSATLAPPSIPVALHSDQELERLKEEMRAEIAAMRNERAAAQGARIEAGERASDAVIMSVRNTERVFRAKYQLPRAAALGDELHAAYCAQIADDARAAGYQTVRGGGRRVGSGVNEQGQRVEIYEIYARKQ